MNVELDHNEELNISEIRRIELGILDYVHKMCEIHNLTYYLTWGTLLGAVRHNGFIPWDDDIDISMPRDDYDKLIRLLISRKDKSMKYRLLSPYNTSDYPYNFAKIIDADTILIEHNGFRTKEMGVYIDVFPIDYLPDGINQRRLLQNSVWTLRQIKDHALLHDIGVKHKSVLFRVLCALCSVYGWKKAISRIDGIIRKQCKSSTAYMAEICEAPTKYYEVSSDVFGKPSKVSFEGKQFYAPNNPDKYLRNAYGDYMTLPPEEKRVSNHSFTAMYREKETKN